MHNAISDEPPPVRRKPSRMRRLLRWKITVPLLLLVAMILAPVLYRQSVLWRVPDIGDPFPISEVLRPIPLEENAYPLFEEAFALRKEVAEADSREYWRERDEAWHPAHTQLNKYLELNRPALEKWRAATEKNDYQFVPIAQLTQVPYINSITSAQANRDLVRWCEVEIDRLTRTGRPAEALPWLRASFRGSALVTRNSTWLDYLVGAGCFAMTAESAVQWMQHPDVTRDELLHLLGIVQRSARLMEKLSTTTKVEYVISRRAYAKWSYDRMREQYSEFTMEPPVRSRFEAWLRAEPEFSRRLAAHVTANHLPFVDAPRRERPPIIEGDIFDESAVVAAPAGRLPAHDLSELLKRSKLINAPSLHLDTVDRMRARSACLQVALAAHAYYRDHERFPARLADLQPEFLPSLPDDPYARQAAAVVYRVTGEEAVVYSRYANGIDDGGTTVTFGEAHISGQSGYPPDFGLRLRRPGPRD